MRMKSIAVAALIGVGFLSACASNSGKAYTREQARGEQNVRFGVVDSVRDVRIEGTKTPIGAVAGGVAGGVAGNSIGGGHGRGLFTILGAVLGGLGGGAAEEGISKRDGVEITVRLDNGNITAVTQEAEADDAFYPGDRVRLLSGGGVTRVAH